MPTVVPTAGNYDLARDVLLLLVQSCLQVDNVTANFVDGFDGNVQADKFHLYSDFFQDQPDFAGVVRAQQNAMEDENPVRRATITMVLRAPDDVQGRFSGRQWANQACECVVSYIRQGLGVNRTLVPLSSGRKILSFFVPQIIAIGQDNGQRWVSSVVFDITYTEHELLIGG